MANARLKLLGSIGLSDDGVERSDVTAQSKRLAILAYLALADSPGHVRRDTLLAVFWPEEDTTRARRALRQSIYFLRQRLPEETIESSQEQVRIVPGALEIDVLELRKALDAGAPERVLDLFQGELMPGFFIRGAPEFERWLDAHRARLRDDSWKVFRDERDRLEAAGDVQAALRYGARAYALRPLHEATAASLMALHDAVGNRARALEVYESLRSELHQHYGTEPGDHTRRIGSAIRGREATLPGGADQGAATIPLASEIPPRSEPEIAPSSSSYPAAAPVRPWDWARTHIGWRLLVPAVLTILLLLGTLPRQSGVEGVEGGQSHLSFDAPTLAVLPPQTLTSTPEERELVSGLHGLLIHVLDRSTADGLRVTARQSVLEYGPDSDPKQIATELGVDYLITGTIEVHEAPGGDRRARIILDLVRTDTGLLLWSAAFESGLAPGTVMEVQESVAREVAANLAVTIMDDDLRRAAAAGTDDREAFELYLRSLPAESDNALPLLLEAVEREPAFLLAHARLARVYGEVYQYQRRTREVADSAVRHAQMALQIDRTSPDAILGLAWASYRVGDLDRTEELLAQSRGSLRGEYERLLLSTYVDRRRGRVLEALESMERAIALNPRARSIQAQHAATLLILRRFEEAIPYYVRGGDRPDQLALARWALTGDASHLERGDAGVSDRLRWEAAMHRGDWDGASDLLRSLPDVFVSAWAWQPIELIEGWVYEGAGRHEEAQTAFQAAADRARDRLEVEPEDERARGSLALALAGLGDMDDAIRTAELAVERQPAFADVVQGPHRLFELAAIHARTGHVEEAVSVLETLLSTPNMYNAVRIEGEFLMRPLRGEPVFETLIERERARVF